MQRTPVDCFDCSLVLTKLSEWLVRVTVTNLPNHKFVIVASTGKCCLVVGTPPEAANLLSMSEELLDGLRCTNVSHEDCFVFAAACDK